MSLMCILIRAQQARTGGHTQNGEVNAEKTTRIHVDRIDDRNFDHLHLDWHGGRGLPTVDLACAGSGFEDGSADDAQRNRQLHARQTGGASIARGSDEREIFARNPCRSDDAREGLDSTV